MEGEREMTKKETAIFNNMYYETMSEYMKYVMSHEKVPDELLGRACILTEMKEMFFLRAIEQGE